MSPHHAADEVSRKPSRWLSLGLALAGLTLAAGAGCASGAKAHGPSAPLAQVVVENHTDWPWRVAFEPIKTSDRSASAATDSTPRPQQWLTIAPRAIQTQSLAGGAYRLHREVIAPDVSDPSANLAVEGQCLSFAAGRTYTWPLGTLFSTEESAP